jgi:hypothetical protein
LQIFFVQSASVEDDSLLNELRTFHDHLQLDKVGAAQSTSTKDAKPVKRRQQQGAPIMNPPRQSRPVITEHMPCQDKRRALMVCIFVFEFL